MPKRNSIRRELTSNDRSYGYGKSAATLAKNVLENLELGVPYELHFVKHIPDDHKDEIQAELQKRFENWANSWIAPNCRAIIAKTKKNFKRN